MSGIVKILGIHGKFADIGMPVFQAGHIVQSENDQQEHDAFTEKIRQERKGNGEKEIAALFSSEGDASPKSVRKYVHILYFILICGHATGGLAINHLFL